MRVTCFVLHKTPVSCQLTRVFLLSLQPADLASKHGGSKASRHLADVAARFRAFRMPSCAACAGLRFSRSGPSSRGSGRGASARPGATDYGHALATQSVEAKRHDAELLADFGHEATLRVKGLPMADPFCACMKTLPTGRDTSPSTRTGPRQAQNASEAPECGTSSPGRPCGPWIGRAARQEAPRPERDRSASYAFAVASGAPSKLYMLGRQGQRDPP